MTGAKTDCFAYRPGQRRPRRKAECAALDDLYCRYGKCRFYKEVELILEKGSASVENIDRS